MLAQTVEECLYKLFLYTVDARIPSCCFFFMLKMIRHLKIKYPLFTGRNILHTFIKNRTNGIITLILLT